MLVEWASQINTDAMCDLSKLAGITIYDTQSCSKNSSTVSALLMSDTEHFLVWVWIKLYLASSSENKGMLVKTYLSDIWLV